VTVERRSWQRCEDCGQEFDELDAAACCGACGGLLAVQHARPSGTGEALRRRLDDLKASPALPGTSGVWRFGELILPTAGSWMVSHPEGNTPLLQRDALSRWADCEQLLIKHEGQNPTGSFKDRGMAVAMTQARRLAVSAVACASTGNTAAALAAYAGHAGIPALTLVPAGKVAPGKLAQTVAYGARIIVINGDFDACMRLVQEASRTLGVYLVNSVNPFRIEGQKSIVFEMLQQLAWDPPDWIALPAGNLGNTAAFGKALDEAVAWGLIARRPRLAAIQAAGAAPFAVAFDRGFDRLEPVQAETVATAIRIGNPASYHRAVQAIRGTAGVVARVSDAELLEAKSAIDRCGVGCEPASAASLAGVRNLRAAGTIGAHDRVVAVLTGHLLKDPGTPDPAAFVRIEPTLDALQRII
jgi:threonine synthase